MILTVLPDFRSAWRSAFFLIVLLTTTAARSDDAGGFRRALFDGQTLHGWIAEGKCAAEVENECLRLKSGQGWLRHETQLGNFELRLEWKSLLSGDARSGLVVRCSTAGDRLPQDGYWISLQQGVEGSMTGFPQTRTLGLVNAPGEWNSLELSAIGPCMRLKINQKMAWCLDDLQSLDGWFGLVFEASQEGSLLFRNLQVTEHGYQSLFNGRDLSGWEAVGGAADECWSVVDGLLTCSGRKGPWLRSAVEYGDFNLRLEYRLSEGGNSGVYVRVPSDGNHHREDETQPIAGFEVQILDDSAPQYAALKDFQYSASIYDFAGANPRVSRPVGDWNSLEINCHGTHVSTWHNGLRVTDITAEDLPTFKLRSVSGFLGLQNHSTVVAFRNVRLGPAKTILTRSRPSD